MQFIKYSVTGFLGVLTNLIVFYLLAEVVGCYIFLSSIFAYVFAAFQNYVLNHYWSFNVASKPSLKSWFLFLIGSMLSLSINLLVLYLTLGVTESIMISQSFGLFFAFFANYFFAKKIVYKAIEVI